MSMDMFKIYVKTWDMNQDTLQDMLKTHFDFFKDIELLTRCVS